MTHPGNALAEQISGHLSRKLLLVLVAILATVSLVLLAMVVAVYKNRLVAEHARASLEVNHLLQASLENAMLKRDIPGLRDIVGRLGTQAGIAGVMIVNPLHEVRFASRDALLGSTLDDEGIRAALAEQKPQTLFLTAADGRQLLRSINPVANKPACGECHGPADSHPVNGLLVVDYDAAGIRGEAMRTAGLLGLGGVIVIFASGFGTWLAVNRLVLRRVNLLTDASRRLAAGALETRAEAGGRDEIGSCADSFNQMAATLQSMIEKVEGAEETLQAIIDSIPDGVRVIDSDFTIVKANHAYCRQVGKTMGEVVGDKCHRSSHGRAEPCPFTLTTCPVAVLAGRTDGSVKFTDAHQASSGEPYFVEVSAAPISLPRADGAANCVVESIRDLSQDVELSQKHRLSEIGLLATGVAHEIHNPLSSIELALTTIRSSLSEPDGAAAAQRYIDIAKSEIAKCQGVTEGLMRLSEPPREPELVTLATAIDEVVALLSFQMEAGRIVSEINVDGGLRVLASDSDIRMIAINLAQNAIHAMPQGGSLRITGQAEGDEVVLRFADTGIGIPHEYLGKIFLPFWTRRGDGSTGRGLGLSICKAIVERYGGTIAVRSTVGAGTEFTVTLPNADAGLRKRREA